MNKLYRFSVDFGRMGDLSGIFVSDDKEVANLIGKTVYFGEVLGKHSDISLKIESTHFVMLTDDQSFITKFEQLNCTSGTNPFNYIE
jgi:hypothetical protein